MTPSPEIQHFLRLARAGAHPTASSGAHAAFQLAAAVLDHVPALDGQALAGLQEFCDIVKAVPESARTLVPSRRDRRRAVRQW